MVVSLWKLRQEGLCGIQHYLGPQPSPDFGLLTPTNPQALERGVQQRDTGWTDRTGSEGVGPADTA